MRKGRTFSTRYVTMHTVSKSLGFPFRFSRSHKRTTLTWGASLALVAGFGSLAARWVRNALKRDEGMTINLHADELEEPEEIELDWSDLLWVRTPGTPPPPPDGLARPEVAHLAPPDVQAFELRASS